MTDTSTRPSEAQKQASLQRALGLMNRNEVMQAEAVLASILLDFPDEPDALQLQGALRRSQGRNEEAEALYRRSLALKPEQPHVYHNLGNLLLSLNRFEESATAQREAVRQKPNYAEAHLGLGLALCELKDYPAAEKCFRDTLRVQPNMLLAKQSLSAVLNELDRPKEAETVLRQALAAGSRDPRQIAALEHNLGVSLKLQENYDAALRLFDSAQLKVPDMPVVDFNRGNTPQKMGRPEQAINFYRRALARNPLDMQAHRELNGLLYRLGRDDEFLRSFDEVIPLYPDVGQLPLYKGNFLYMHE